VANPPKKKGTGAETELKSLLEARFGRPFRRTPPGASWDLETADGRGSADPPIMVLATRPDRGRWLFTMPLEDWADDPSSAEIRVESKRYKRFAHHTIYEEKFG